MEHLLEDVAARILQVDDDDVGINRIDALEQVLGLGDAHDVRIAGLAQSLLQDGGADCALVDDDDLEARVERGVGRILAPRALIRPLVTPGQIRSFARLPGDRRQEAFHSAGWVRTVPALRPLVRCNAVRPQQCSALVGLGYRGPMAANRRKCLGRAHPTYMSTAFAMSCRDAPTRSAHACRHP